MNLDLLWNMLGTLTGATAAFGILYLGIRHSQRSSNLMPGVNEPFGLRAYQITILPQPGNYYDDNEFNTQLGRYIPLELPSGKLTIGQIKSIQIIDAGLPTSQAVFIVLVARLATSGPLADIIQVPLPPS